MIFLFFCEIPSNNRKISAKGGGSVKNDIIIKGGCKIMAYNDKGVKIAPKTSEVINGWPLLQTSKLKIEQVENDV